MSATEQFSETIGNLNVTINAFHAAGTDERALDDSAAEISLAVRSLGLDYFTHEILNGVDVNLREEVVALMKKAQTAVSNLPKWRESIADKIKDLCFSGNASINSSVI